MSVSKNNSKITASDITDLKNRLNDELKRRGGEGSVYGYIISNWDVNASEKAKASQQNKLLKAYNAIQSGNEVSIGDKFNSEDYNKIET